MQLELKLQDEKSTQFYRDECAMAWHEAHISKQREIEAMGLIVDLKQQIKALKQQVQRLRTGDPAAEATKSKQPPINKPVYETTTFVDWKKKNCVWDASAKNKEIITVPSRNMRPSTSVPEIRTPMQRVTASSHSHIRTKQKHLPFV